MQIKVRRSACKIIISTQKEKRRDKSRLYKLRPALYAKYVFITDTKIRINQKSIFVFGPHQKWCEILRKNVLSRVVHAISGVIHNPSAPLFGDKIIAYGLKFLFIFLNRRNRILRHSSESEEEKKNERQVAQNGNEADELHHRITENEIFP